MFVCVIVKKKKKGPATLSLYLLPYTFVANHCLKEAAAPPI